mgnify:CR=1 FL=1
MSRGLGDVYKRQVREDVNGDWNVNTDEYLQLEMSTLYTEDPAYANVTVPVYTIQKPRSDKENMVIVYCAEGYTKSQQKQFVEDVKKLWGGGIADRAISQHGGSL